MEKKLSLISGKDCYEILKCIPHKNASLLKYTITGANNDAVGFLGEYFQLSLLFEAECKVKEEVYFLKTEPTSNKNQKDFVRDCGLFKKEAFIYEKILPELMRAAKLNFAPQCFLIKEDLLVLEDLKRKKLNIVKRDYTLEECVNLVSTLAHFHASSIIFENKSTKTGDTFSFQQYLEKLPEDLMRTLPFHDKKTEDKLMKIVFGEEMNEYIKPSKKFRNVLTHNDLWSNNIFLHENGKCQLVDFQLVRYTPPAYDLIMALYLNNSTGSLKENWDYLTTFYYETMRNVLRDNRLEPDVIFSSIEFYESIEVYKTPALIEAAMFAITVYLPEEKSAYIRGDSERYRKFTFENKTFYVMDSFEKNQRYREKILGLLTILSEVLQGNIGK